MRVKMDTHCHQVQVPLHILILFVIIIPSLVQASISQSVQKQTQQYFRTRPEAIREINEGQTVIIKCEVGNQAGPVQWVKNGFLLGFNRSIPGYPRYSMVGNGADGVHNLRIEGARIEDEGEYQCQVGPGPGSKAIRANSRLSVLYAARIKRITEMVLMDEGKDAVLECEVDANPISTVVITWRRRRNSTSSDILDPPTPTLLTGLGGNGIVESSSSSSSSSPNLLLVDEGGKNNSNLNFRTKQTMERNRSLLIIHNVSRDDSGSYDCLAFNGIGYEDSATANLVVKHKPVIDRSPILGKEAGSDGETGRLLCRARGAPNVTFSWFREGSIIKSKSPAQCSVEEFRAQKYWIKETVQLDLITFQSVLLINKVSSSDYGLYKCIARNILGFDAASVNFSHPLKPDPPLALRIINVTHHSVTLKWIPGFDGGLVQSFRIRFKPAASDPTTDSKQPFIYSDVFPPNTTMFEIGPLPPSTVYTFSIMAYNPLGESDFTTDIVKAETLEAPPEATIPEAEVVGSEAESSVSVTEGGEGGKVIPSLSQGVLSAGKQAGEVPKLIIIIVTVIGSSLLLLNIVLVVCFLGKKKKKRLEEVWDRLCKLCRNGDESGSTRKEGAVEMTTTPGSGAPSSGSRGSYNHGMNETSLSGSDEENKSERASSAGYSATEYPMQISAQTMAGVVLGNHHHQHQQQHQMQQPVHHQGISTYLIDDNITSIPNYYPTSMNPFPNYVQDVTGMTTIPTDHHGTIGKEYIYTIGSDTIPPSFNSTGLRSLQVLNSIPSHQHQQHVHHNHSPSHYSLRSNHQVHVQYDNPAMTTHLDVDCTGRTDTTTGQHQLHSYLPNGNVVS